MPIRKSSGWAAERPGTSRSSSLLGRLLLLLLLTLARPSPFAQSEATAAGGEGSPPTGSRHKGLPALSFDLVERWRLPSQSPEGDVVFGAVEEVQWADDGTIYLLDYVLKTVHVLSPDGSILGSIGREGEGPGEFQVPQGLLLNGDARIGVLDFASDTILFFNTQGIPIDSWSPAVPATSAFSIYFASPHPRGFVLSSRVFSRSANTATLTYLCGVFDTRGTPVDSLALHRHILRRGEPIVFSEKGDDPLSVFAVDSRGFTHIAPEYSQYLIHTFDSAGTLLRAIQRDTPPVTRTPQQQAEVSALLEEIYSNWRNAEVIASSHERAIMNLQVMHDDILWVESSAGWLATPDSIALVADLYDSTGCFLREVELYGELDPWHDVVSVCRANAIRITAGMASLLGAFGADSEGNDGDTAATNSEPLIVMYDLSPRTNAASLFLERAQTRMLSKQDPARHDRDD